MKLKLYLLVICGFLAIASLTLIFLIKNKAADKTAEPYKDMALQCLNLNVDCPDLVEIESISEPEKVMGRSRLTQEEKIDIAQRMMALSNQIMQNPETFDYSDTRISDIMNRQMKLSPVLNTVEPVDTAASEQTGWKVKLLYEGMSRNGNPYRSEYWVFFDRDFRIIYDSFEVPVL